MAKLAAETSRQKVHRADRGKFAPGSGNVRVKLPSNAAFDADISTSSGSVDVGEPVEMTVQGRIGEPQKSIRGKVHGGGPLLRVRTGSGDIHID